MLIKNYKIRKFYENLEVFEMKNIHKDLVLRKFKIYSSTF